MEVRISGWVCDVVCVASPSDLSLSIYPMISNFACILPTTWRYCAQLPLPCLPTTPHPFMPACPILHTLHMPLGIYRTHYLPRTSACHCSGNSISTRQAWRGVTAAAW